MRIANKVLIFFFLIACSILLPSCNQQTTRINHLNRETLNVSLDSTVAFIAERNTSETRPTVRVFCSGFFISERLLLSALHCFQDTVTVRLPNDEIIQIPTVLDPRGREFQFVYRNQIEQASLLLTSEEINEAFVVSIDQETDLAILELSAGTSSSVVHLFIASENPELTEIVYVIGHPAELAWSINGGIISRILLNQNLLQTNISIVGGYSGGPLINTRGEVVGLADAYIRNVPQVSFFISRNRIYRFLQEYYSHGTR